jgi:hypothetical protein
MQKYVSKGTIWQQYLKSDQVEIGRNVDYLPLWPSKLCHVYLQVTGVKLKLFYPEAKNSSRLLKFIELKALGHWP